MPISPTYVRIYDVVRSIPEGKVATYGQVASIAGRCGPRQVGYALHALSDPAVPWQRVVNAKGEIAIRDEPERQREQLEAEGVGFDARGRVLLTEHRWDGE